MNYIKMESVLRKLNPETGLYDYMEVRDFIGPDGDPQSFREHDGWKFCDNDIWDIQKMENDYMIVLYEFDEDSTCLCSTAFDIYQTTEEAKQAITKEKEKYYP